MEPYRPGLKLEKRDKESVREGQRKEEEEEEEEEPETIPTPRKRLMNFKIPILNRRDSRRDQNASVITRRRLFSEEGETCQNWLDKSDRFVISSAAEETRERKSAHTAKAVSRRSSYMGMTSDISSEDLSEEEEEEEEEEEDEEEEEEEESEEGVYDVFAELSSE